MQSCHAGIIQRQRSSNDPSQSTQPNLQLLSSEIDKANAPASSQKVSFFTDSAAAAYPPAASSTSRATDKKRSMCFNVLLYIYLILLSINS